ncbi:MULTISPECIES: hypothetical protein [Rhodobacterales]|uniref:hypothetical protein n=1 Tax=Rhodobacterales TaxID=204455 RepID=UPI0015F0A154|nr:MULTISPECIES: hypothetical protein [Rhodobacterales]MDO6590108.1 hypothetical protein [Yoonia sp. 1_MG-2023]
MKQILKRLAAEEDGAVTVDFVVLTGAICTLGLVVVTTFSPGAINLANEIENTLDNVNP